MIAAVLPAVAHAKDLTTPDLRVIQLNIRHGLSPALWAADAQRATSMADIADFQEATESSDRDALMTMLELQGWGYWIPEKGGVENPITWNASRFSMVSANSVQTIPGQKGVTPARFINTVVLRENLTGRLITVINTHTLNKGAPDGGLKQNSRTERLKTHLVMLRDAILAAEQTSPYVVATGDLNVNYMRDRNIKAPGLPTDVLGPFVNFNMPIGPTWGGTTELDYVMTPKLDNSFIPVSSAIIDGFRSDHHAVLANLDYNDSLPVPPTQVTPTGTSARFAPATLANHPRGNNAARRTMMTMINKGINNAPAGSAIHLETGNLADGPVRDALLRAHKRGVYVQVVTRTPGLNSYEKTLRSALGTDTTTRTWFSDCTSKTCQKVGKKAAPTTLLVSQSGQTSALRLIMNRYTDKSAVHRAARGRITTDLKAYNTAFHNFFLLIG